MNQQQRELAETVGRYFIRACKNNDIYEVFKKQFNPTRNRKVFKSPSGECKDIFDMFEQIAKQSEVDRPMPHGSRSNNHERYDKVTNLINILMRFYLESGGVRPQKLGMIGQTIFNLSCYKIWGDEFLDDMEQEMKSMGGRTPQSDFELFCLSQYDMLSREGRINMKYDDFLKQYHKDLQHAFEGATPQEDARVDRDYQPDEYDDEDFDEDDLLEGI